MYFHVFRQASIVLALCAAPVVSLHATMQLQIAQSLASPQPVGATITWTATATDSNPNPVTYKFEVAQPQASRFSLLRDFNILNTFDWTPSFVDGKYQIRITARDYISGESVQQVAGFQVTSRVAGQQAVVSPTGNPLVALFSAPSCPAGSYMRVSFLQNVAGATATKTNWRACHANSMNFYIGGMLPGQTYVMNYQVATGSTVTSGPTQLSFTTGALPPNLGIPPSTVTVGAKAGAATGARVVLVAYYVQNNVFPVATDLAGNVIWYYPIYTQLVRPENGGTFMVIANAPGTGTGVWGDQTTQYVLREIDLAGNVLRETNVDRVNEQLASLGTGPIGRFHHDVIEMPNGNILVFGDIQAVFPAGTQGSAAPVDIIGDMIVVLDPYFQVLGYWNAFDHAGGGTELDINRPALRGEICTGPPPIGCPPAFLPGFTQANDWLHTNSLQYLPDGNLLVSSRSQDWIFKIAYGNNDAEFHTQPVLWRLGLGGDFTMTNSADPYPWFSSQHDAGFEDPAMQTLSVYDNGASRINANPGQHSRGQVFTVDQTNMVVSPVLNADLGVYSTVLGSAQMLPNGDYHFQNGKVNSGTAIYEQSIEVNPSGSVMYKIQSPSASYRTFRMSSLYAAPTT